MLYDASEYDLPMLSDALTRARRLVEELERTRTETEHVSAPELSPEQLAQGRQAIENALASARRALTALDAAYETALPDRDNTDKTNHVKS
jgi:hypothetical protein